MASRPRFNKKEVEIRVRPNRRGDQRRPLVPWWMRLEKRHLIAKRAQVRGKRGRNIRTQGGAYQRRSVVKVMYTRNGKPQVERVGRARTIPDARRCTAREREGSGIRRGTGWHRYGRGGQRVGKGRR